MDGLNVHGAIVDEVHAHKTRDTWDVIETATGSRRQPLMFAITTVGIRPAVVVLSAARVHGEGTRGRYPG